MARLLSPALDQAKEKEAEPKPSEALVDLFLLP